MDLYGQTMALLERTNIPKKRIAEDLGVSRQYLRNLRVNPDGNPGVRDLQRLHDYLLDIEKARSRHVA